MRNLKLKPNDVFWLARYAYNTLQPVFAEAKEIDPSIRLDIELSFDEGATAGQKFNHIGLSSHWERPGMFMYEICLTTKDEIDRVAERTREEILKLRSAA